MQNNLPEDLSYVITEFILMPDSSILEEMIGQRILDIGFYEEHSDSREKAKERIKKVYDEYSNKNMTKGYTCFSDMLGHFMVLVLDKQHLTLIAMGGSYPKLQINSNLTLEGINKIQEATYGLDAYYSFFSVKQDPDMADELVKEMIGKKILAVDLIKVVREEYPGEPQYPYCIIRLYLENGITRLIGSQFEDELDESRHIREGNDILPERIERVYKIRKAGYMD